MKPNPNAIDAPGPFRSEMLKSGDPYELSNGHPIYCLPTGGRGALRQGLGFEVIANDPAVENAAIDPGISPVPGMLRAPDIAVGVSDVQGWSTEIPPLTVEYADVGQDEADLQAKIDEFLSRGTRYVWVVRLTGIRRIEVYEPNKKPVTKGPLDVVEAPGILKNPIPVKAFFDAGAARAATLKNLLQREGFEDLAAVRNEGLAEGKAEGLAEGKAEGLAEGKAELLLTLLEQRFGALDVATVARVRSGDAAKQLQWATRIFDAKTLADVLDSAT